jgi:hypothetical protein
MFPMNFRFLILDLEIEAVVCITDSAACANSLISGLVNTKSVPVPVYYWNRFPGWKDKNFDTDYVKLTDDTGPEISELDKNLITEKFLSKRKISISRRNTLITVERYLEIPLLNSVDYFDNSINFYIKNELDSSSPADSKYSAGIIEYADMLAISPDRAFNELEFLFETQSRLRIRNLAVYKKYSEKINQSNEQSELDQCLKDFYKDCFLNARF